MNPQQAQALASALRKAREAETLSVRGLGARAGVDQTMIVRLENGAIDKPAAVKLRRLAEALLLPPTHFMALAGYVTATDLPAPRVYLRTKYPDLPADAVAEAEVYLRRLMRDHRIGRDDGGPADDPTAARVAPTK
jgi:transcriptional regulator with XRE-family HTH domain